VLTLARVVEAEGADLNVALEGLRNLERGFRLQAGFRPDEADALTRRLREGQPGFAVGTSVELKFPRPVFAGQRLGYRIRLTGEHPGGVRFEAEASVEDAVVASGVMMGALIRQRVIPAP
jgi:3-hydroxymyristoyl/3-hydroxydecanoyl-(acyl carrier protein) dehydratase